MTRSILLAALCVLSVLRVVEIPAVAQRTTATLHGSVEDTTGGIVVGASATATHEATGAKFSAKSDGRGSFVLSFLPVGKYTVVVEAPGFKSYHQSELELNSGVELRYPVTLQVGSISEQVTVRAEVSVVQNATATLRETINTTQTMELPQSRRNFTALLAIQNGLRDTGDGRFQFNGLASAGSTITVDGTDASGDAEQNTTSFYQNFNFINVISQEAVQEVQVSKGIMSADVARTFGGNVNVVTKSGSNEFHGSLFENFQNDKLNARYTFLPATAIKPPVRFNQFGGSLGGRIIRDKLFFFGTYEGYRQAAFATLSGNVPTREFRDQAVAAVPAYKIFLDRFPLPTQPYAPGSVVGLFFGANSNRANENHAVVRGDYLISSTDRLAVRYTRSRPSQIQPRVVESNFRTFTGMSEVGNVNYTKAASSWTSETRFGFNMMNMERLDQIWVNGKIPAAQLTGFFSDAGEGLGQGGHIWSVEEVFAKIRGAHSFKFGGIFLRRTPGRWNEEVPEASYANVADYLANRPVRVQVTFGTTPFQGRAWEAGFFVQDDYRIRPNLILNIGARYEYMAVYKEREGRFFNPDGALGAVQLPPRLRPPDSAYNADRNNFSPRVGLAWNVDKSGKTVVRTGAGFFVAPFSVINFQTNIYTGLDIPFRSVFTGADITNLGLKYPVYNVDVAKLIAGRPVARGYPTFDPQTPNPYNAQWTLDIQRQLTAGTVFQIGYVGNKALKITNQRQFNLPDRVTGVRPYPAALQFIFQDASDFSYYHSMQTSLRSRLTRNVLFDVHYTWSRAMAIGGGDFSWGGSGDYANENNWRADKSPAQLDVRHRFVSDFVYEVPADKWLGAAGPLRHVVGGWQVSGILVSQTGGALSVTQSNPRPAQRPDYLGGDPYLHGSDNRLYLNRAAFALVPISPASSQPLRNGNLGRGVLRAPGAVTLNFALGKNFHIKERMRLQVRGEMFNAFNHVNLSAPVSDLMNPNFGRITGAAQERRMQLTGRFTF
ncbi:MAG TPA: carboxypeptidase regulatory-like domain-containing protein [Bryobacteraceae bacterium]|nr:carboxypeptidase regulatory-like domain-containing protein [Bryobacteraceae bacterium]